MNARLKVCQILLKEPGLSETFLSGVPRYLDADVTVLHGYVPRVGAAPVLSERLIHRSCRKAYRTFARLPWEHEVTHAYLTALRRYRTDVALAEYGPTGGRALDACVRAKVPLVVRFHGYDATYRGTIEGHAADYRRIFTMANAIVVPALAMKAQLVKLGAPEERVHKVAYGVDCRLFDGTRPDQAPPTVLAVGRFVEKKAPHLTLLAFSRAARALPEARLRFIGDGPLLDACRVLATALGVRRQVEFLGGRSHEEVRQAFRSARVFVQHSVAAPSGDSEGLPNSLLEAGAMGVPVVSTQHAGIPEMIRSGEDGYLVDEHDVDGMAAGLGRLLESPALALQMGTSFRNRVRDQFSMERSMSSLHDVLNRAASRTGPLAPGIQGLASALSRTRSGMRLSEQTASNFPFGYFMVARKD